MGLFNRKSKKKESPKVAAVKVKKTSEFEYFKYLDNLIHSGEKVINLDTDIKLSYSERSKYPEGIDIRADDLVIDGKGHTIDARGRARIFHMRRKNITIKNLIFKNGFSEENGGAIAAFRSNLTIEGCTFEHNIVNKEKGGAIYCNDSEMDIKKSTFFKNAVIGNNSEGGAIYGGDKLTVSESKFSKNIAFGDSAKGGAIGAREDFEIRDSEFGLNMAKCRGGAITTFITEGSIINCSFDYNISPEKPHIDSFHYNSRDVKFLDAEFDKKNMDILFDKLLDEIKDRDI